MASELLTDDDRELLGRLAGRVVELHMEVPAILAIETGKPLSLLASQALLFFEPLVQALLPITAYRRVALLLERREALEHLTHLIEVRAEAARAARSTPSPAPPRDGPRR